MTPTATKPLEEGPLALVVAHAHDRVIGREGGMPWHFSEDLRHFKRLTRGHAVLMGRKTYESIGRPLPDRRNLVISRQPGYAAEGCEVFPSFEAALAAARETDPLPFVIGGAAIYSLALPRATRLYVTEIDEAIEGDTRFPAYDPAAWVEIDRIAGEDRRLTFRTLERSGHGD